MAVTRRAGFRRPPKPGKRDFQPKEQLLRGGKGLGFDPIDHSVVHVPARLGANADQLRAARRRPIALRLRAQYDLPAGLAGPEASASRIRSASSRSARRTRICADGFPDILARSAVAVLAHAVIDEQSQGRRQVDVHRAHRRGLPFFAKFAKAHPLPDSSLGVAQTKVNASRLSMRPIPP